MNSDKPAFGLRYIQVVRPAPPTIHTVLGDHVSRRAVLGGAVGIPVLLSALGNPSLLAQAPTGVAGRPRGKHTAAQ